MYDHDWWFWLTFFGLLLLMTFFATGCRSARQTATHDTIYVTRTDQQVVERVDSVFIDRWREVMAQGDTIYVTNTITEYRLRMMHDTLRCHDTIYVSKAATATETPRTGVICSWRHYLPLIGLGALIGALFYYAMRRKE